MIFFTRIWTVSHRKSRTLHISALVHAITMQVQRDENVKANNRVAEVATILVIVENITYR